DEMQILATSESINDILSIESKQRTAAQKLKLRAYFFEQHAPEEIRSAYRNIKTAQRELADFREKLPTVMVMEEMPQPRQTHVLVRGQYDKPGERVEPNVPAELAPLPTDAPRNRLGLARWLVDRANPLTSRVFVNRIWQLHF